MKLIFRYSFVDKNGKVHRARKGHPFPIWIDEEKEKTQSKKKES